MVSKIIDMLKSARTNLTRGVSAVTESVLELRNSINAKGHELAALLDASLPLPEAQERIQAHVRFAGEAWLKDWGASMLSDRGVAVHDPQWDPREPSRYMPSVPWQVNASPPWGALCAADPDAAAAMLMNLLRRLKESGAYVEGPPAAARPAMVAKLEDELAKLEATEETIIDEAAAAGVVIEHRLEVVQRREQETSRRKNEAAAIADRQEREAALNARKREPRIVRSEYLRQGKVS